MNDPIFFDLSSVFSAVAGAVPDQDMLVWRERRLTYGEVDRRVDAVAAYLRAAGLGCHTEREHLARHESGQDHLGIYLRNGTEYLEAMIAGYRARVAPFNVSYRYVEDELTFLLADANARAVVYHAEFAPRIAAIRAQLPRLQVLIQIADESGNDLLPGAVDYETIIAATQPTAGSVEPSGDDLYILYTGGTTGMPKGVLWRQHDIFLAALGGRPYGSDSALASYAELADRARQAAAAVSLLMVPPFIHGAAQWGAFNAITLGGRIVIPDDVHHLNAHEVLQLAERERVLSIPVVGDAIARPLVEALELRQYDLTSLAAISNGGASLSPSMRDRIIAVLPHVSIIDGVGSSESGLVECCRGLIADYKIPKAFVRAPKIIRSPAGKADYRWAATLAAAHT